MGKNEDKGGMEKRGKWLVGHRSKKKVKVGS